jgi:hypothetical protein
MSFLSRKPARPEGRGSDAGRDDEYDDYDGYAHDAYQNEDEGWSPNEYFSPEGIKGRWAGEQPEGRAGGRGRRDNGRGEAGPGYDAYTDNYGSAEYGGGPGYGADEFVTGVYDLPDGADEDRSDRSRRKRRDREDRGERTGILRLRRDRGEDIWPDDGISDEDYWASVAADRPLNGTDAAPDNIQGAGGGNSRPGADGRPRMDARPGMGGTDSRFGGEQRGAERGATGRLGPPPGLAGDYQPGAPGNAGAMGAGQPGGGRTSSGPMPARPGTGPQPVRPGTGPTPTVGVTASRPPAGRSGTRPGPAQPGPGPNGLPQPAARPSFQPNGHQAGGPTGGRPQDRGDWGDRTERIERVNASGYPDPRPSSRSQGPSGSRASGPLGRAAGYGPAPAGSPSFSAAPGRGRGDNGRPDNGRPDNAAWQALDHREPDRRDHGRETSGGWPAQAGGGTHARGGAEDDPLTSKAYSRSAQAETDGRSYRAAARRSEAQTQLTEQAETFITSQYERSSQHQAGHTGDYWQYRDDAPTTITQATAARYPAPGGQRPGGQGGGQGPGGQGSHGPGNQGSGSHGGHPAQPGRSQVGAGHGQGPARGGQPGQPGRNGGRTPPGLPVAGLPGGQYDAQQPRPSQQQRQQPQQRQPSQAQLPAAGLPPAGAAGGGPGGTAAGVPAGARPTGTGGQNPYDSGVTGSYPYPGQSYAARSTTTGPMQGGADDRYYRPSPADGYGAGGAGQNRTDQGRGGNGNGYPATGDRRY